MPSSKYIDEHGLVRCVVCNKVLDFVNDDAELCEGCDHWVCKKHRRYHRQFPFGWFCDYCDSRKERKKRKKN